MLVFVFTMMGSIFPLFSTFQRNYAGKRATGVTALRPDNDPAQQHQGNGHTIPLLGVYA
jgi:hypothetical protein